MRAHNDNTWPLSKSNPSFTVITNSASNELSACRPSGVTPAKLRRSASPVTMRHDSPAFQFGTRFDQAEAS